MKKVTLKNVTKYVVLALAIFVDLYIIISGFLDGEKSSAQAGRILGTVENIINTTHPNTIVDSNRANVYFILRKIFGHFALCGVAGMLNTLTLVLFLKDTKLSKLYWPTLFTLVAGFVIAVFSEMAQLLPSGRGASFTDVLIDYGGYLLATLATMIIVCSLKFTEGKNEEKKQA